MKLHEYQSKQLLAEYGVPVPGGDVATNSEEALRIAKLYNGSVVVKAQVLMGGRGKAGGVRLFDDAEKAAEFTGELIGKKLVSIQNPAGMVVEKVLVAEKIDIDKEFYLSVLLDRAEHKDVVMISARGGMDIEEVAHQTPQAIVKLHVNPKWGLFDFEIRDAMERAEIDPRARSQMAAMIKNLYLAYKGSDATLIEINPCALTPEGKLIAADAKVAIDENALFRHKTFAAASADSAEDPIEAEAARRGIAYVRLDGNVGVIGNGAGLVMLTLDEVARAGQKAANFLDVGGGAQAERVKSCVELVLMDEHVKALLINIFGGITRGDEVAKGVVSALKELNVTLPIVVRIEGTNAEEALEILSGANLIPARSVQEAAQKVAEILAA
ncbi:MAG TPA: ADP-forming succinate--CoA ligase subunit beta [Fimbriimonadales bacterium]|jgi:succinyl-CoA synthetase beta subunit|nr:ADP-forming succinate--CoA ligase subunit beta [Fimbriimonadales bacterium]